MPCDIQNRCWLWPLARHHQKKGCYDEILCPRSSSVYPHDDVSGVTRPRKPLTCPVPLLHTGSIAYLVRSFTIVNNRADFKIV